MHKDGSLFTANNVYNVIVPIAVVLITWFLARIKNPDYGKKDWKCKEVRSSFSAYTIFLIVIFMLPLFAYIFSVMLQKIYIEPMIGIFMKNKVMPNTAIRIYMIMITIIIYFITYRIVLILKISWSLKKINKGTTHILSIIIYLPIILNFIVSMNISIHIDVLYYSNRILIFMLIFQIIGMIVLDDRKTHKNKKMMILTKDGNYIHVNVADAYKKGRWLRIIVQKTPFKEKLILFDDIKSIEYYD